MPVILELGAGLTFGGVFDDADIGNADRCSVDRLNNNVLELIRSINTTQCSEADFPFALFDHAAWDLDVLSLNRVANLID